MSLPRGTVSGAASGLLMAITEIGTGELVKLRGDLDVAGSIDMDGYLKINATKIDSVEISALDGVTFGAAQGNKALIADMDLDIGNIRNLSITNNIDSKSIHLQDGDQTITTNSNDEFGNVIKFQKSRNATDGSFTKIERSDFLGSIEWYGSGDSSYYKGASIGAAISGEPGNSNDMPTSLIFSTTADNFSAPIERLTIDEAGHTNIKSGGELRLWDDTGGDYVGIKAHADTGEQYTLVMPPAKGSSNQYLMTDNNGNLNWNSITGSTSAVSSCRVATTTELTFATDFCNGKVIDNITIQTGDRILI